MHSKSNNIKSISYIYANEVVDKLFESLRSRYPGSLKISMRGSDFTFDSVQLMCCKCHKVNFKPGGSYTDSPAWIKRKKAIISPKNTADKSFQNAATVALNYEKIEWNS